MLDADRVTRLGSLVAIGVATQLSQELMKTESSAHSFWNLVALSLLMVAIQTLHVGCQSLIQYLNKQDKQNWIPWTYVLMQTFQGLETVLWTLYGNAVGIWVLRIYLDLYKTPLFFYFLPVWFFGKLFFYVYYVFLCFLHVQLASFNSFQLLYCDKQCLIQQ